MTELAKRAVACKGWRWMKGMTVRNSVDNGVISSCWHEQWHEDGRPKGRPSHVWVQFDEECRAQDIARPGSGDWYPDLTDPATLGCLLALVREAWEGQFTVCGEAQLTPDALVAALEAAP